MCLPGTGVFYLRLERTFNPETIIERITILTQIITAAGQELWEGKTPDGLP